MVSIYVRRMRRGLQPMLNFYFYFLLVVFGRRLLWFCFPLTSVSLFGYRVKENGKLRSRTIVLHSEVTRENETY